MNDLEKVAIVMDEEERMALASMAAIFGDDTNAVLNALVVMSCKVAIMAEVPPAKFATNVKETWDGMAEAINSLVN